MVEAHEPESPAYRSLYRRYRPQLFAEVRGQDHTVLALRNAVKAGTVGHAYLFSGPRGTGKTSTARILAKALNCAAPDEGEPCGTCASCTAIAQGGSPDVHELDAASNNGVEAMRDLVARASLGTPGRWKVYIIDEVHMLSTAASNALLKTLEEPPGHVVFVLATTDPHKVLATIRSRTQHFEFHLLPAPLLAELLEAVRADANLTVPEGGIASAVRKGRGSARDALSVLDQVAVAGAVAQADPDVGDLVDALCERDAGAALVALARDLDAGGDPQQLANDLVEYLRQGFLAMVAPALVEGRAGTDRAKDQATRLGLAGLVRTMEVVGRTQVEMRDALEPRVLFEVTLVRLAHPDADDSPAALLERLETLERRVNAPGGGQRSAVPPPSAAFGPPTSLGTATAPGSGPAVPGPAAPGSGPAAAPVPTTGEPRPERGASTQPGAALGAFRASRPAQAEAALPADRAAMPSGRPDPPVPVADPPEQTVEAASGSMPTRDDIVQAWGDTILPSLTGRAKARYRAGHFAALDGDVASFALPDPVHRDMCETCREDVEAALTAHFGTRIRIRLTVDETSTGLQRRSPARGPRAATPERDNAADHTDAQDTDIAPSEIEEVLSGDDAGTPADGVAGATPEARLLEAFPGAREVEA